MRIVEDEKEGARVLAEIAEGEATNVVVACDADADDSRVALSESDGDAAGMLALPVCAAKVELPDATLDLTKDEEPRAEDEDTTEELATSDGEAPDVNTPAGGPVTLTEDMRSRTYRGEGRRSGTL